MDNKELKKEFSFWYWFFKYGLKKFLNWWLVLHLVIATSLSFFIRIKIDEASILVIVPLAGILIGLSFAWVGNAMALLESEEVKKVIQQHEVGLKDYIFTYQLAILLILTSIISWALVGLKIQAHPYLAYIPTWLKHTFKIYLFFMVSISIRECWQIVMSTQWLLILKAKVKELINN